MSEQLRNGNGMWKIIATCFISLSIGLIVAKATEPRDIVTEKELALQISQMNLKIDAQTNEIRALQATVNRIATKVGVTVIAPGYYKYESWPTSPKPSEYSQGKDLLVSRRW